MNAIDNPRVYMRSLATRAINVALAGCVAEALLVLPYAHALAEPLAASLEAGGRRGIKVGLPVGLRSTSAWLDQVARALGRDPRRAAKAVRRSSPRVPMARASRPRQVKPILTIRSRCMAHSSGI